MQHRNVQFEPLSDIIAFRIVVPTRQACYAAIVAPLSDDGALAGAMDHLVKASFV